MSSPRKNISYNSPYTQNVGQYPSQNTEYMSKHSGGMQSPYNPQDRHKQAPNSNQSTPHFYRNNAPQQNNFGFYEDRQSSPTNIPHFYQNKIPGHQFGQRGGGRPRGWNRGRRGNQHQRQPNNNVNSFSQYFHNSMLEDPWQELMERHNAIHGIVLEDEEQSEQKPTT